MSVGSNGLNDKCLGFDFGFQVKYQPQYVWFEAAEAHGVNVGVRGIYLVYQLFQFRCQ